MSSKTKRILTVLALLSSPASHAGAAAVVVGGKMSVDASAVAPSPSSQQEDGGLTPRRPSPYTPGTTAADWNESPFSDKYTGGTVERGRLEAGTGGVEITVDVPAFRLTLWQHGREIKTYRIGVGLKDYPLVIGERRATEVIWNPVWIPPDSDWVGGRKGVKPGQVIKPTDPRNPLGKIKIPLGGGYLIHQATGFSDLGNLVSHGCVRMLRADLFDLADKINAAYGWPVPRRQVEAAKRTKKTLVAELPEPLRVDINYDTLVVERGSLHVYPDVYGRGTNTVARLRAELEASGVDASRLGERELEAMLSRAAKGRKFVVDVASLESGRALEDGELRPVLQHPPVKQTAPARRRRARA